MNTLSKSVRSELSSTTEVRIKKDSSVTIIICTVVGVASIIIGFGIVFGF